VRIKFLGGARTVTGSLFLYNNRFLIEAGLFQGHREEAEQINRNPPIDLSQISAILLTHAHLDHSGNIPNLIKKGYQGPIYATRATIEITSLLLRDAAHIFEQDIAYLNKKLRKKGLPEKEPLYTIDDVERSLQHFEPIPYHHPFQIGDETITFFDAGHILGSAQIRLEGPKGSILFSGDLGRRGMPFLRDPELGIKTEVLVLESTYGGRNHEELTTVKEKLIQLINKINRRKSRLLIPAFAVERTQDLIYLLHELEDEIPPVPIYVDSPLAQNVTRIFKSHVELYDREAKELIQNNDDPLGFGHLHYIRDVEESKWLNDREGPLIIISASGMCEGGRILHHLKRSLTNPDDIVLFVGFQARNTLGRRLIDGVKEVKVFGEEYPVRCEIVRIDGLSSHADQNDLITYVKSIPELKRIFLIHGEEEEMETLAEKLKSSFTGQIDLPQLGEEFQF